MIEASLFNIRLIISNKAANIAIVKPPIKNYFAELFSDVSIIIVTSKHYKLTQKGIVYTKAINNKSSFQLKV